MSVTLERLTGYVCKILLNRPTKRNAINHEAFHLLRSCIDEFERDDDLQVAILAGSGGSFCSGYDLNETIDRITGMPILTNIERMLLPLGTRLSKKKVTVAAIEGCAAGFGFELALKCDIRICDRDARMGFLNRRFGIPILNGGTVMLPDLVGGSRSPEIVATGRSLLGPEAVQIGLVQHIADIGCSSGKALNISRSLVKFNGEALLNDLESVHRKISSNSMSLLQEERQRGLELLQKSGPMTVATRFLSGELCRHGKFDLGNLVKPECEVTL